MDGVFSKQLKLRKLCDYSEKKKNFYSNALFVNKLQLHIIEDKKMRSIQEF